MEHDFSVLGAMVSLLVCIVCGLHGRIGAKGLEGRGKRVFTSGPFH